VKLLFKILIDGTMLFIYFILSHDFMNSISGVPSFPGLRRFTDGQDFHQWTGDDSKALMKV
jgi:hypothetical protein